jgi:CRP-like cAMP-binding protein
VFIDGPVDIAVFLNNFDKSCSKMFDSLSTYLVEKGSLTNDELKLVEEVTVQKRIRKRQYLLQEGDVSNYISFVVKGCLRLYLVSKDGQEHIMRFSVENWWVSDYDSFHSGLPSKYNIDALEDSELLMITKKNYDLLTETIPNFKRLIDKLSAKNYEAHQNRILSNISETAEEKYQNFIKTYPAIFDRVPLHMVASFLGLSRETLSRVRQQNARKHGNNS